jgi:hypothetical protein
VSVDLTEVAVAIIGFNRPDFIRMRLRDLEQVVDKFPTYVSLDGPRTNRTEDIEAQNLIMEILNDSKYSKVKVIKGKANYGCDKHIPNTIEEILGKHNFVLIVEDDVSVSSQALLEMANKMIANEYEGKINPVLGISSLTKNILGLKNRWRYSKYFTAWGYGLSRAFWKEHLSVQSEASKVEVVDDLMRESKVWMELSSRRQEIWRERLLRGNYDYQIQQTLFAKNIETVTPVFRILTNHGHGDARASHTKFGQPSYLKEKVPESNYVFHSSRIEKNRLLLLYLHFLDSNTWAGDGIFSVRGRTFGFRTLFRRLFNKKSLNR